MRCAAQLSAAGRVWPAVAAYLWLRFRRGFRSEHRPEPLRPPIYLHAGRHARPNAGRLRWPRPPRHLDVRATRYDDCHRLRRRLVMITGRIVTRDGYGAAGDDGDLRRPLERRTRRPIGRPPWHGFFTRVFYYYYKFVFFSFQPTKVFKSFTCYYYAGLEKNDIVDDNVRVTLRHDATVSSS